MRADELLDAIGEVSDIHIQNARRRGGRRVWVKWVAAAACLCLMVAGGYFTLGEMGGRTGGGSRDDPLVYMHYVGPVLPLTVQGKADGICAQRNVNYDFSPYFSREKEYVNRYGEVVSNAFPKSESIVTDSYVLTNETERDRTLTLLYPFVGNLRLQEDYPVVTVNGEVVETALTAGPHAKEELNSFEEFSALLADRAPAAPEVWPTLDQPVTVYRLHDYVFTTDTGAENPALTMSFFMDREKTRVLSYGTNGWDYDEESGCWTAIKMGVRYRPDAPAGGQYPGDGYVILLGEDMEGFTLRGYRDLSRGEGEELEDLSCTVTRYETTLGDAVRMLARDYLAGIGRPDLTGGAFPELYCGLLAEQLEDSGLTGEIFDQHTPDVFLHDLFEIVLSSPRVLWLSFRVTVPAGERVALQAVTCRGASMDHYGRGADRDGYDMATLLGSCLTFSGQSASVSGYEEIEIVDQNFGFDLSAGITEVELDLSRPHYWLEVRRKDTDK